MEKAVPPKKRLETARTKGRGKQPKRFLDKNDALELAASIAGRQEEMSLSKAEKHHNAQSGQSQGDRKPKISASKLKLRETKALLAAKETQLRKEKVKLRKQRSAEEPANEDNWAGSSTENFRKVAQRKRVSFA